MKPPAQRAAPAPPRPPPTVLMGEIGGVRTMIWSAPPLDPVPPPAASWTATAAAVASCSSSEESAAQLLLNLGQESRGKPPSSTSTAVSYSSAVAGPPLNMERLWAGDLTQLPAAQQMQALNLTASGSAAQPWVSNGGTIVKSEAASQSISFAPPAPPLPPQEHEEDETPMICMICEDKATGLHYGIITCEGWVSFPCLSDFNITDVNHPARYVNQCTIKTFIYSVAHLGALFIFETFFTEFYLYSKLIFYKILFLLSLLFYYYRM